MFNDNCFLFLLIVLYLSIKLIELNGADSFIDRESFPWYTIIFQRNQILRKMSIQITNQSHMRRGNLENSSNLLFIFSNSILYLSLWNTIPVPIMKTVIKRWHYFRLFFISYLWIKNFPIHNYSFACLLHGSMTKKRLMFLETFNYS